VSTGEPLVRYLIVVSYASYSTATIDLRALDRRSSINFCLIRFRFDWIIEKAWFWGNSPRNWRFRDNCRIMWSFRRARSFFRYFDEFDLAYCMFTPIRSSGTRGTFSWWIFHAREENCHRVVLYLQLTKREPLFCTFRAWKYTREHALSSAFPLVALCASAKNAFVDVNEN